MNTEIKKNYHQSCVEHFVVSANSLSDQQQNGVTLYLWPICHMWTVLVQISLHTNTVWSENKIVSYSVKKGYIEYLTDSVAPSYLRQHGYAGWYESILSTYDACCPWQVKVNCYMWQVKFNCCMWQVKVNCCMWQVRLTLSCSIHRLMACDKYCLWWVESKVRWQITVM